MIIIIIIIIIIMNCDSFTKGQVDSHLKQRYTVLGTREYLDVCT